ncbi:unnamed protein product [Moneuplotes crassus]|uniref:Uncharacterized protein n=1 Tax=Euplotes crassus TaxID=5936 RepID=A0AAD2D2B6_EUPCR|nr:unnamed protein product [Moneuplotes crassus]
MYTSRKRAGGSSLGNELPLLTPRKEIEYYSPLRSSRKGYHYGRYAEDMYPHYYHESIRRSWDLHNAALEDLNNKKAMIDLAKQNQELKHKIKEKHRKDKIALDASLKLYKLKQDIYGQLQEDSLKQLVKQKQRAIDDDVEDRAIHDILATHQDNLKGLTNSIFVAKEEKFKQAADDLHAKLSEIEARRLLDKKMSKNYKKQVKRLKNDEEYMTNKFMNEYQRIDYLNNMYNPYYVPPISGIGALNLGNGKKKDM